MKQSAKKNQKPLTSLKDLAHQINEGRISSLPREITLNLSALDQEDVNSLLEVIRLKSFGPGHLWKTAQYSGPFAREHSSNLQLAKALVEAGKYSSVESHIKLTPSDDPELIIQEGRAKCFLGEFEASL